MQRITDDESQTIYENSETYDLLTCIDQLDRVRGAVADGVNFEPPEIRDDLLELHGLAMAVANNGETSAKTVYRMFMLADDIEMQVDQMLEALTYIDKIIRKLTRLWPASLEFYEDD